MRPTKRPWRPSVQRPKMWRRNRIPVGAASNQGWTLRGQSDSSPIFQTSNLLTSSISYKENSKLRYYKPFVLSSSLLDILQGNIVLLSAKMWLATRFVSLFSLLNVKKSLNQPTNTWRKDVSWCVFECACNHGHKKNANRKKTQKTSKNNLGMSAACLFDLFAHRIALEYVC